MCLIVLAWRTHPRYRLIVAANRDEYFGRPTAPAAFWDDHPGVLAGRDLEAGGTWLGITPQGRFAALTNYRNPADQKTGAPSRGALVSDFLTGSTGPGEYVREIEKRARDYNGFSLLAGDTVSMYFFSNRGGHAARVEPGVHGLSNHLLDTPWPKVEKGKAAFSALLDKPFDAEAALHLLDDTQRASDELLPSTGVSLELEERLSAIRIPAVGGYGTRCSTVLSFAEDGKVEFHERSYREDGGASGTVSYRFTVPRTGRANGKASDQGSIRIANAGDTAGPIYNWRFYGRRECKVSGATGKQGNSKATSVCACTRRAFSVATSRWCCTEGATPRSRSAKGISSARRRPSSTSRAAAGTWRRSSRRASRRCGSRTRCGSRSCPRSPTPRWSISWSRTC